jgi:hypothetical protein
MEGEARELKTEMAKLERIVLSSQRIKVTPLTFTANSLSAL